MTTRRPFAVDLLEGMAQAEHLARQGLVADLSQAQLADLGRAVLDQRPNQGQALELDADGRRILNEIAATRAGHPQGRATPAHPHGQAQDQVQTRPEAGTTVSPDLRGDGASRAHDPGQDDHQRRAVPGTAVPFDGSDPIDWYLKNVPDEPDELWSP